MVERETLGPDDTVDEAIGIAPPRSIPSDSPNDEGGDKKVGDKGKGDLSVVKCVPLAKERAYPRIEPVMEFLGGVELAQIQRAGAGLTCTSAKVRTHGDFGADSRQWQNRACNTLTVSGVIQEMGSTEIRGTTVMSTQIDFQFS